MDGYAYDADFRDALDITPEEKQKLFPIDPMN
jgi:hypothetical protein